MYGNEISRPVKEVTFLVGMAEAQQATESHLQTPSLPPDPIRGHATLVHSAEARQGRVGGKTSLSDSLG